MYDHWAWELIMKARDFSIDLEKIASAYVAGGILKTKPSCARVVSDLTAFGEIDVDAVILKLKRGEAPQKPGAKSRSAAQTLRSEVVDQYLKQLKAANGPDAVRTVISAISADRKVRATRELIAILSSYSGGAVSGKNKPERIDGLMTAYRMRQRGEVTAEIARTARGL